MAGDTVEENVSETPSYFTRKSEDLLDIEGLGDNVEQSQQDAFIQEAIAQGIDLREYASKINEDLRAAETESVAVYVEECPTAIELYEEIQECDAVLARMQEMLLGFQADLGGISDEIRHLQTDSLRMNHQLKNRKEAESWLRNFL